jgi:elongation factor G
LKKYSTENIRNLTLVGHGSSGKTSLVEAMLFVSGTISRQGKVEESNTTTDYEPEETKRHISLSTALAPLDWKGCKINLIDTPGYADFIGEVIGALRITDCAAIVVDAVSGVEVQTERVWNIAEEYNLPRVGIINRLDKENANFNETIKVMKEVFGERIVPIQIPIGQNSGFKGIIDLITQKAYLTENGKVKESKIPTDLSESASKAREELIDRIAETDDVVLEKYLEGEELSLDEIKGTLTKAIVDNKIVPIFATAATTNIGITCLLDSIVSFFPSPKDRGEITGIDPKTEKDITRKPDENEPLSALVFKTVADPYVGRLSFFRVYSGTLKADSTVMNVSRGHKEKIGHIFAMRGKNQIEVTAFPAGDIGAVPKLTVTETGDTLADESAPILFKPIKFPEPVISVAVEPKSKGDEEKLSTSLTKLTEEDTTLTVKRDHETKQMIASGLGDMHLEVTMDRLKRKFGVEAVLSAPKVPYKETVKSTASVQGKYKKQTGGRGQYGDVWLKIEPLERGGGFEFVDKIVGGVVPQQYRPAVEKGIKEAMDTGVIAGYPVVDLKVTLYDGSYHPVDSSEIAFKIAASMALKKGVLEANPVLLEPIMKVEVTVPEEFMGDVIGDLSGKRGKILGMEPRGRNQVVKAMVPLAEMATYASELRSITRGRGAYTMEFSHYEEVPSDIAKRIIEEAEKARAEAS